MKTILYYLIISVVSVFFVGHTFAQGVSVNSTGAAPDPSAGMDINFSDKGMLIPRMTTTERNAIPNPAQSLQIFNTTTMCFEFFAYGMWQTGNCAVCQVPEAAGTISGTADVCPGHPDIAIGIPNITYATGYIWEYTGTGATITGTGNSVTVGFSSEATSGILTVKGNNQCGDGPSSPGFSITVGDIPSLPSAGVHVSSPTEIIWNWNAVSGASGYKYNTINNYASATDNGSNTSNTQSGLTCNSSYTLYVWAYNSCGNSTPLTLTQNTSSCFTCGTTTVTFPYKGSSVTYGTVAGQNGSCWLDRNLGASNVATAYNDAGSYGDLFQWGRLDDGHQNRNSGTTTSLSSSDTPWHSNFIKVQTYSSNWQSTPNNNLWQGASGINNPCPSGWRIPTLAEFVSEGASWSPQDFTGAFASPLKWPLAGIRNYDGTAPQHGGTHTWYWSSNINGTDAYYMWFFQGGTGAYTDYVGRAHGLSVRCIMDL